MDEGRRRLSHLRNDPRVTLTVLDEQGWYTHVMFSAPQLAYEVEFSDLDGRMLRLVKLTAD